MTTGPRILVADADEEARLAFVEAVAGTDQTAMVGEAASGPELGRALRDIRCDVLFVDVGLPRTDEEDVAGWRSLMGPRGIIVIVTDLLEPRWPSVATRIGAYDVFLKPLDPMRIRKVLDAGALLRRRLDLLVVDPNHAIRSLIRRLLARSHFSFDLLEAGSGREAVAMARRHNVDLAFIELGLPDMPGLEVACQIQSLRSDAKLVATGQEIDGRVRRRLATSGVTGFLRKPFHFADVDKTVHEVFGLWRPYLINALQEELRGGTAGGMP